MTLELLWKGPALLGEGPVWHMDEQALYWVDILQCRLYRWDYKTTEIAQWQFPAFLGCIAPRANGGLIAAVGQSVSFIELPGGELRTQCVVPTTFRLNDGKCDCRGRFWFGSLNFTAPTAALYCYTSDGRLREMVQGLSISNGLDWSPDDRVFYHTDSATRCIYAYDFSSASGELSNKRVFAQLPVEQGVPDGLTIDSEGCIWSACFEGGRVIRYSSAGQILRVIELPVSRPTSCTFGGPDLDILFVTSCSQKEFHEAPLSAPAGAVFAIKVETRGLPAGVFK